MIGEFGALIGALNYVYLHLGTLVPALCSVIAVLLSGDVMLLGMVLERFRLGALIFGIAGAKAKDEAAGVYHIDWRWNPCNIFVYLFWGSS